MRRLVGCLSSPGERLQESRRKLQEWREHERTQKDSLVATKLFWHDYIDISLQNQDSKQKSQSSSSFDSWQKLQPTNSDKFIFQQKYDVDWHLSVPKAPKIHPENAKQTNSPIIHLEGHTRTSILTGNGAWLGLGRVFSSKNYSESISLFRKHLVISTDFILYRHRLWHVAT